LSDEDRSVKDFMTEEQVDMKYAEDVMKSFGIPFRVLDEETFIVTTSRMLVINLKIFAKHLMDEPALCPRERTETFLEYLDKISSARVLPVVDNPN